jgi:ABC-type Na+ efflux pump permease subunit
MTMALPGPTAGRLSGERERRTWAALLLTALRPSQVVSANLLASLRGPVVVLAQLLPLLMMGAHAARLPPPRFALIVVVLLASSIGTAAVSLWLSGRCRHTRSAATLAYLLTGSWIWGALAVWPGQFVRGENLWWYFSPAWQVAVLSLVEPLPGPLAWPLLPEWVWFLLGCTIVSGLLFVLLTRRIARAGSDER